VKGSGASDSSTHFGANPDLASLGETLVKLKEEVTVCLERLDYVESVVVGILGSGPKTKVMDSRQVQCSGWGPTCVLKIPLGPQFKSGALSTYKDWVGKGFGEPSRPMGWSKPKAKAVYKRKSKLSLGGGQAFFKSDPKGKNPAHHASSSSAYPWVSLDIGQADDPGVTSSTSGV